MAHETHVSKLETMRAAHVDERRRLVQTALDLAAENNEPVSTNWGQAVSQQQQLIEAIDRAIADERKLEPIDVKSMMA